MKKLLQLIMFALISMSTIAQTTAIPDANFEQALINLGYDSGAPDGSVLTSNISGVTTLGVGASSISDLTGIQDFTALTFLVCSNNELTSLDVTQNTALTLLDCSLNQLTSLDVTQNIALAEFNCGGNQLSSLDVTQNIAFTDFSCRFNQLTSLDFSQNTALTSVLCDNNQLTCLNMKNGNNQNITSFTYDNNPDLSCMEVDLVAYSEFAWYDAQWSVTFSTDCPNPCFVGVNENELSSVSIYPNPSNTGLIQTNTNLTQSTIKIYSIEGKQINFIKTSKTIDISDNEKGVYLISIDGKIMKYIYQN